MVDDVGGEGGVGDVQEELGALRARIGVLGEDLVRERARAAACDEAYGALDARYVQLVDLLGATSQRVSDLDEANGMARLRLAHAGRQRQYLAALAILVGCGDLTVIDLLEEHFAPASGTIDEERVLVTVGAAREALGRRANRRGQGLFDAVLAQLGAPEVEATREDHGHDRPT